VLQQSVTLAPDTAATLMSLREGLELANKRCSTWFFVVAALSVVNSVLAVVGADWNFPFGLGIAQLVDAVRTMPLRHEPHPLFDIIFAVLVNFTAISFYVTIGVLARYAFRWAYTVGLIAYGLDLLLASPSFIGILFHFFVLMAIYDGFRTCRKLVALDGAHVIAFSDGSTPRIIVPAVGHVSDFIFPDVHARMAKRLIEVMQTTLAAEHDIVQVNLSDLRHLDRAWYEQARAALEQLGFRYLSDLEDRTDSLAIKKVIYPTAERIMLSADGTVRATVLRHPYRPLVGAIMWLKGKGDNRTVMLVTEFANGAYIFTDNTDGVEQLTMPPQMRRLVLPRKTAPASLYETHLARVAEYQTANSIGPVIFADLAEVVASMQRLALAMAEQRGEGRIMTFDEVMRLVHGKKAKAACIYYAMLQLQRRDT
jgi:hypothetical protein